MKNWLIGAVVLAMLTAGLPSISEAKRLGGGKSTGMQRNMPARTAPDATPAKPASPALQQAAPATAAAAPGAAAAAAPKRSWMGPIAGLAAGLGIAALMSHLGLGEAFGNFLMLALLAVAGIALVVFLMRKFGAGRTPALASAGAGAGGGGTHATSPIAAQPTRPQAAEHVATQARTAWTDAPAAGSNTRVDGSPIAPMQAEEATPTADVAAQAPAAARAFVPAAFDSEGFSRTAKMIFIRLQAANDSADLDDLRRFTTPELFAEVRLAIQERGTTEQHTDVLHVEAEVLDVAQEPEGQVVSVRFTGQIVEEKGGAPADFHEIWHLVKPNDDSRPWAIAGIEQLN